MAVLLKPVHMKPHFPEDMGSQSRQYRRRALARSYTTNRRRCLECVVRELQALLRPSARGTKEKAVTHICTFLVQSQAHMLLYSDYHMYPNQMHASSQLGHRLFKLVLRPAAHNLEPETPS